MKYRELRSKLTDTKIDYNTKLELIKSEVETELLQRWAVKVAESVLPIYEKEYPNDSRVRDCINATTQYLDGKITKDELFSKRDTANAANAAYAAAYAANASYAAYNAAHAAHAAANAAAHAAYAAYYSANAANAANKKEQQELNIKLLLDCLVKEIPDTKLARRLYKNYKITNGKLVIEL